MTVGVLAVVLLIAFQVFLPFATFLFYLVIWYGYGITEVNVMKFLQEVEILNLEQ